MKRHGLLLLVLLFSSARMWGLGCSAPSQPIKDRVASYVRQRYQIPATAELSLKDFAQANASCFWKMSYETGTRQIVVYLSPEGGYITPLLYDLSSNPLMEQQEKAATAAKELVAGEAATRGPAKAPVSLVEFSDFECPYCKRLTEALETEVLPKETGKASLVFRYFPLTMHPWAKPAAEMAECARMQKPEAFWDMHDTFFAKQTELRPQTLRVAADGVTQKAGLNAAVFDSCMAREQSLGAVQQDLDLGKKYGVHATPTLFVNGTLYAGPRDAASLERMIEGVSAGRPLSEFQSQGPGQAISPAAATNNQCGPTPARTATAKGANHEIVLR